MKLLLDQGLPRTAAEALGRVGFDAVHTGAIGLAKASDEDILERARREGETVVTFDADFHALLALSNAAAPAVIRNPDRETARAGNCYRRFPRGRLL